MNQPDLFDIGPRKRPSKLRGYYLTPGSGPAGETCGTCKHHAVLQYANNYHKCLRVREGWTSGYGTDILVRSPACSGWELEEGEEP